MLQDIQLKIFMMRLTQVWNRLKNLEIDYSLKMAIEMKMMLEIYLRLITGINFKNYKYENYTFY
jgi:hypothetical protein